MHKPSDHMRQAVHGSSTSGALALYVIPGGLCGQVAGQLAGVIANNQAETSLCMRICR